MGLPSLPHKNSTVSNPGNAEVMAQKWVKLQRRRQNKHWHNRFNTQVNVVVVVIVVFIITATHLLINSFSSLSYNRSIAFSKRVLHRVLSSAPSFNLQYPLVSLRPSSSCLHHLLHLLITSIFPSIFPTTKNFRRQFLHKMWPIQLVFFLLIVCMIFPFYLTHYNHSSLLTQSTQLIIFILLQHQISKLTRYFSFTFRCVQVLVTYNAMLQKVPLH